MSPLRHPFAGSLEGVLGSDSTAEEIRARGERGQGAGQRKSRWEEQRREIRGWREKQAGCGG